MTDGRKKSNRCLSIICVNFKGTVNVKGKLIKKKKVKRK